MITLNRLAKRCFDIALKRKKMTETTSPKAVVLAYRQNGGNLLKLVRSEAIIYHHGVNVRKKPQMS